jgi:hypothetical protein
VESDQRPAERAVVRVAVLQSCGPREDWISRGETKTFDCFLLLLIFYFYLNATAHFRPRNYDGRLSLFFERDGWIELLWVVSSSF